VAGDAAASDRRAEPAAATDEHVTVLRVEDQPRRGVTEALGQAFEDLGRLDNLGVGEDTESCLRHFVVLLPISGYHQGS
jgi:hypothetical protein